MKILVLSRYGEIVDICWRMVKEGNDVTLFILDKTLQWVGEGWGINKVDEVSDEDYDNYDLIIFDDSCWGDIPLKLRQRGHKVIGGSALTDKLEEDREFFFKNCYLFGINTPHIYTFDQYSTAINFIKKYPKQYILKSYSDDKSITCMSKMNNSCDLIMFLAGHRDIKKVILQPVVRGYEVAISCFFNGQEFIPPVIINYEYKKFGTGNTGVYTGEMGTVVVWQEKMDCKLFNSTLKKIEPLLKGQYVGIVDINTITNTKGSYALEITPRFGYPISDILSENIVSWSKLLYDLANGDKEAVMKNILMKEVVNIGAVMLAISPMEKKNCLLGIPFASLNLFRDLLDHFRFFGIILKNDLYYVRDSYLGVATSLGKNIEEARQNLYSLIPKINTPPLFYYRTDIGEQSITAHKWLSGLKIFH